MAMDRIQDEVFAFLRSPSAWGEQSPRVETIETHGALVFMAGDQVMKVRRAVRLPYLDFSTLAARRRFAERELALNAPHAPGLYRDVIAITREIDGSLAVGGNGTPVEWVVRMARFGQEALLTAVVEREGLPEPLAKTLADTIFDYHAAAPRSNVTGDSIAALWQSIQSALASASDARVQAVTMRLDQSARSALEKTAVVRDERARSGHIRRCHGDLHLGNIVLWQGRLVPFDAIEFDETLATVDTLYDLAFLLMDLDRHQARDAANIIFNRYLWRSGDLRDLQGLAAMPLYLALRAAIRAVVALDRAKLCVSDMNTAVLAALKSLWRAEAYLTPATPWLIAIGGLSGTGKTTLAKALAPSIGAVPGALHVRSDLERKWLAKVVETERLPEGAYTAEASQAVYERVLARAQAALQAGQCVIADAVFARAAERDELEAVAQRIGCRFSGLWLTGQPEVLKARVQARVGDASDATACVVEQQTWIETGMISWTNIDVACDVQDSLRQAQTILAVDAHQ